MELTFQCRIFRSSFEETVVVTEVNQWCSVAKCHASATHTDTSPPCSRLSWHTLPHGTSATGTRGVHVSKVSRRHFFQEIRSANHVPFDATRTRVPLCRKVSNSCVCPVQGTCREDNLARISNVHTTCLYVEHVFREVCAVDTSVTSGTLQLLGAERQCARTTVNFQMDVRPCS